MESKICANQYKAHTENKAENLSKWDCLQNALIEIDTELKGAGTTQVQQNETDPYADEWRVYKEERRKEVERLIAELKRANENKMEIEISSPQPQEATR